MYVVLTASAGHGQRPDGHLRGAYASDVPPEQELGPGLDIVLRGLRDSRGTPHAEAD